MKTSFVALALAAMLAADPALAEPESSAAPYQVLRSGDRKMSCEALSVEVNALNATVLAQTEKTRKEAKASQGRSAVGKGLLSGLAKGASFMGGYSNSVGGMLATTAASGVAQEMASNVGKAPATPPAATPATPEQQRVTHLTGIYKQKAC